MLWSRLRAKTSVNASPVYHQEITSNDEQEYEYGGGSPLPTEICRQDLSREVRLMMEDWGLVREAIEK